MLGVEYDAGEDSIRTNYLRLALVRACVRRLSQALR